MIRDLRVQIQAIDRTTTSFEQAQRAIARFIHAWNRAHPRGLRRRQYEKLNRIQFGRP